MKKEFESFQFQLNLGGNQSNSSSQKRLISVLITPSTNIEKVAIEICRKNNINPGLSSFVAQSIYEEVEKQIVQKQHNKSLPKKNSPSPYSNKTKKFKNRFCSYLKQSPAKRPNNTSKTRKTHQQTEPSDVSTFRNSSFVLDPSSFNTQDQEYSFRPSCLQTVDLTDNSFQNSFEISQSSFSKCSYSNKKNIKKSVSKQKFRKQRQQRTVFDNLYEYSKVLNVKKQIDRRKSFEKLTFKPELNQMSKKIIQMKKQNNPQQSASKKSICFKSQNQTISTTYNNSTKSRCKQNIKPDRSISVSRKTQQSLSIYQRGMLFRKKSQDKLSRMKEKQFYDQIKACSFKPTIFSKKSVQNSRVI